MATDTSFAAKLAVLVDHAADAAERDPVRSTLVAAVNARLAEPGYLPRSLYGRAGRQRLCTALSEITAVRGWRAIDPDELRDRPLGGFAEPGLPSQRPDPWTWFPARDTAPVKCGERTHKIVWEEGRISTPEHPDPQPGTRCGDVLAGRRVPRRFRDLGQRSAVIAYGRERFEACGITAMPIPAGASHVFARTAFLEFDELYERYEERMAWWDGRDEDWGPARGRNTIHDPARPDLTCALVRSRRDPGSGWRTVKVDLCLSAWWQIEVLDRPWQRIGGLTTLDVLTWDLERSEPIAVLLLDWQDVEDCPGHVLGSGREKYTTHEWDNVWPVLATAEVAFTGGSWRIVEVERRPAPAEPRSQQHQASAR